MTALIQAVAIGDNELRIDTALAAGQVPGFVQIDDELLSVGGQNNTTGLILSLSSPAREAHDNGATVTYAGRPYDPTFKMALAGGDGEQTVRLLEFDVDHADLEPDTPFNGCFGLFLGDALTSPAFVGTGDVVSWSIEGWDGHADIKLWVGAAVPANIGDTAGDFYARPIRSAGGTASTTAAALSTNVIAIAGAAPFAAVTVLPASLPVGAQLYAYVVDDEEAGLGTVPTAGTERIWVRLSEPAA